MGWGRLDHSKPNAVATHEYRHRSALRCYFNDYADEQRWPAMATRAMIHQSSGHGNAICHFYNNPGRMCRIRNSQLRLLTVHTKDTHWVLSTQHKHMNRGEIKFLSNINSQQALVPFRSVVPGSLVFFFAQQYERYGSRTFQETTRRAHTRCQFSHQFPEDAQSPGQNVLGWNINLTYPRDSGATARTRTRLEKCN